MPQKGKTEAEECRETVQKMLGLDDPEGTSNIHNEGPKNNNQKVQNKKRDSKNKNPTEDDKENDAILLAEHNLDNLKDLLKDLEKKEDALKKTLKDRAKKDRRDAKRQTPEENANKDLDHKKSSFNDAEKDAIIKAQKKLEDLKKDIKALRQTKADKKGNPNKKGHKDERGIFATETPKVANDIKGSPNNQNQKDKGIIQAESPQGADEKMESPNNKIKKADKRASKDESSKEKEHEIDTAPNKSRGWKVFDRLKKGLKTLISKGHGDKESSTPKSPKQFDDPKGILKSRSHKEPDDKGAGKCKVPKFLHDLKSELSHKVPDDKHAKKEDPKINEKEPDHSKSHKVVKTEHDHDNNDGPSTSEKAFEDLKKHLDKIREQYPENSNKNLGQKDARGSVIHVHTLNEFDPNDPFARRPLDKEARERSLSKGEHHGLKEKDGDF